MTEPTITNHPHSEPTSETHLLDAPTRNTDPSHASHLIPLGSSSEADQVLKLDELGPMVVNSDGTLSRIANWSNMTAEERKRTMRVLAVRNKSRLAALNDASRDTQAAA